ncbi:cytochrome P450 [Mycena metata]|uniref:Cytochrome P450 n=1 Tax=Mycena metata TaxID=1033252 RepID=A0AAD7HGC5_9AGAR|nr:cytochrome P450 [Mycena metata]
MFPSLGLDSSTWALVLFCVLFSAVAVKRRRNVSRLPLPPGPAKWPLVGNLFQIPTGRQWDKYIEWSGQFNSDIIHLDAAGTSIVVISSMETVKDLFEKRSSLYSDRPRAVMLAELMGWDFGLGDRWRANRRLFHETFSVGAGKQFYPQERAAAHELLRRMLQDPQRDIMAQFRHMAGALILDVTYGIKVLSTDDPWIKLAKEVMHAFSIAIIPGAFMVDTIPALKYVPDWMPGAGFQRKAKQWRKISLDLLEKPFAETKRQIEMGTAPASFTSLNLGASDDSVNTTQPEREETVKTSAANMYSGGADTTVSALGTFALAMLANPEAQKMAQAEIDSVVGVGHLPDFADQVDLPYVSALLKEVLRWSNVAPIAIPHYLGIEDEYKGYRIPAGSVVIGNVWALMHDETVYPEPNSFKPERFLLDGKLNPAIRDPETVVFGFGRRACPGLHLATASLWITMASILSAFNISKALDDDGNEIEPSYEYEPALIFSPLPFKCTVTPRSPQATQAIQSTIVGM